MCQSGWGESGRGERGWGEWWGECVRCNNGRGESGRCTKGSVTVEGINVGWVRVGNRIPSERNNFNNVLELLKL